MAMVVMEVSKSCAELARNYELMNQDSKDLMLRQSHRLAEKFPESRRTAEVISLDVVRRIAAEKNEAEKSGTENTEAINQSSAKIISQLLPGILAPFLFELAGIFSGSQWPVLLLA